MVIYFLTYQNGEKLGYDTEAFAIYDVMGLVILIPLLYSRHSRISFLQESMTKR